MKRSDQIAFYLSLVAIAGAMQPAGWSTGALAAPAKAPAKSGKSAPAPRGTNPKAAPPATETRPQPAAAPQAAVPSGAIAAEVNADKIYVADVDRILNSIKSREPSLTLNTAEAQSAVASIRQTILENLITHRLLYQEAVARKISPAAKDVDAAFVDFRNTFRTENEFNQQMAREGKSQQDVRRMLTEEMAIRMLTQQLTADVKVTDADLQKYYDEHVTEFVVPESVRARHILIALPRGTTPAERNKKYNKANELLKKALSGADFAKLAFDNSEDIATRENGGDASFFTREEMVKPFADVAFSTPPGKIHNKVVETRFGFHIIKVEDKRAERTMTLAELKTVLHPLVLKLLIQEKIDKQIEVLRAQSTIKKNI